VRQPHALVEISLILRVDISGSHRTRGRREDYLAAVPLRYLQASVLYEALVGDGEAPELPVRFYRAGTNEALLVNAWLRQAKLNFVPAHPELPNRWGEPWLASSTQIVERNKVRWCANFRSTARFSTTELASTDIAALLLYLAPAEELLRYFTRIAELFPAFALSVLQDGLKLLGMGGAVVRHIDPLLRAEHLVPLLQSEDGEIREAALLFLSRLQPSVPNPHSRHVARGP